MELPLFFIEKIEKQYGKETAKKIEEGLLEEKPVTLRVNTIKSSLEKVKNELEKNNIEYENVEWNKDALIIKNIREDEIRKLGIYENGEIYLQSLSSMIPVVILEPKEKENILDMTAAPGGKTTQIAAIAENKVFITACEKNKIRYDRLKYNVEKQGVKNINIMQEDSRKLSDYFSFDKILLDAPCSGSGTENVFTPNFSEYLIQKSSKVQEELLTKALTILKPAGEMVYSTCSILKEENEEIVKKVLKKFKAQIIPINVPQNIPVLPTTIDGALCVCPTKYYEGFFVVKILKKS
mgnify:FL=1